MPRPVIRIGSPQLEAPGAIPPRFISYCRAATAVIAATLGFGALILAFIAILAVNGMRPAFGQTTDAADAAQVAPAVVVAEDQTAQ